MKKVLKVLFVFIVSSHSFSQWTNIGTLSGMGTTYPSVSVVDNNVVWIAGGTGGTPVIWRSTNGGTNFTSVTPPASFEITSMYAVSMNECIVGDGGSSGSAGGNAKLYRTTNGGVNWTLINQTGGTGGFYADIAFSKLDPTFGIAVSKPPNGTGQPYLLLKTIDGGSNWTMDSPGSVSSSTAIWHCGIIYDANAYGFGITGGLFPQVRGTSDGGTSWNTFPILMGFGTLTSFAYSDVSAIALASTSGLVARTTDQGTTWQTVDNGGALCLNWIYGSGTCYLMTSSAIKKSTDDGATFTAMTITGASGLKHFDFAFAGGNVNGFAITSGGVVYKLAEPLTGISRISETVPGQFSLKQNYPNPFNPTTKIKFDIPAGMKTSTNVTLVVYDEAGKAVATLVNDQLLPGTYEVTWDAASVSSGVYYYRLMSTDLSETKKMILLK